MTEESEQVTPPSDQPEEQMAEAPQYRKISPDKLKEILGQHLKWVETEGKEGKRADLDGVNLVRTNLEAANLQGARLGAANLQEARLWDANLQKANLVAANLQKAAFNLTILRDANLQDANLTDATGLLANPLAGANVSGASLPGYIQLSEGLSQIEEISKKAGKLFISMLLGCVYAWLTIATTTDVGLLTNSTSSPLPIIQAKIPIAGFYWAAPLILFSLYVWFHFYLQRYWQSLSSLPAVFPDGKELDEKAYPWLLNSLVRPNFTLLRDNRPPFSRLMVSISIVLVWWVMPLTFMFFWLRYLPKHHWEGTIEHIILIVVACVFAGWSQGLAKTTLRGQERTSLDLAKNWKIKELWKSLGQRSWKLVCLGLGVVLFTVVVSDGAINGMSSRQVIFLPGQEKRAKLIVTYRKAEEEQAAEKNKGSVEKQDGLLMQVGTWYQARIPDFLTSLSLIQGRAFADFTEQEVSTRPANWFVKTDKFLADFVKGAQLQGADLRGVNAEKAFLMNADLRNTNLERAYLLSADLEKANLEKANLQGANLLAANLQEASLFRVNLQKADLRDANLSKTLNLTQVQLDKACVDERTKLPEGLKRPEPCSKEVLEIIR